MALKAEIKNIDYIWHAFMPDGSHLQSAGIEEIVSLVTDAWPPIEKGFELRWEATPTKFIAREVESTAKKISKTDRG